MLATLTTLVSEYASDNRRGICMGLLQSGYPLGALLGGFIAAGLIQSTGWQSLFLFGGAISAILLPVVMFRLPESLDFLLQSAEPEAAKARDKIFQRLDLSVPSTLEFVESGSGTSGWRSCFFPSEVRRNTLLLWLCYLTLMFSFYFVASWTPKLLVDAGLSMSQGISAGAILQAGGLLGALVMGGLGSQFATNKLSAWFFIFSVIFILVYGWSNANLAWLMVLSGVMGFFLIGAMIGLYTIAPALYDSSSRVTGVGLAIGVGRLGAIAAPFAGGVMLEAQMGIGSIYAVFALPLLLAALAVRSISLPGSLK
jgi:MFS family permease